VNLIYYCVDCVDYVDTDVDGERNAESMTEDIVHVVETGETLWNIAKRYNTTVEKIAKDNGLEDADTIGLSQKLIIKPLRHHEYVDTVDGTSAGERNTESTIKDRHTVYKVKTGDTLWNIAKRFNTTVEKIVKDNGLEDADTIGLSQSLIIS